MSTTPDVTVPGSRQRTVTVVGWLLRGALALVFAGAGAAKLAGSPEMVDMFAEIGAGQWLRHVVGALEVAAAVGLLVPSLAGLAALGLVALMVGATVANVAVLEASPALTLIILVAASAVVWLRRERLLPAPAPLRS